METMKHFINYLKFTLYLDKNRLSSLLMIFTGLVGVKLIFSIFLGANHFTDISGLYKLFFVFGGIYYVGSYFKVLESRDSAMFYLMLPVSNKERFWGAVLLTSLGWFLFASLIGLIVGNAAFLISMLFGGEYVFFNPMLESLNSIEININQSPEVIDAIKYPLLSLMIMICWHAYFLCAGIWFRRRPILKAVLLIVVGTLFLSLMSIKGIFSIMSSSEMQLDVENIFNVIAELPRYAILFLGVISTFLYLITYYKLREREV